MEYMVQPLHFHFYSAGPVFTLTSEAHTKFQAEPSFILALFLTSTGERAD